jgi:hypothetical protein
MGQITITNDDFVPLNSTLVIAYDTLPDASIVPGPGGANQTWDFSNAVAHDVDTMLTVSPGQTPLFESFPESNYASYQTGDSVYIYFHRNSDKVQLIGVGFVGADAFIPTMKYMPPETLLDFPVNFGDDYTQTFYTDNTMVNTQPELGYDSIRFKSTTVSQTTVDAYGNLTTPMGSFESLRSKDYQIQYDSVWAMVFGNWIAVSATIDTSISYSWWTNDQSIGFMLFSIDMDMETNGVSDVTFLQNSIQSVKENSIASAKVFPNPSSDLLNLEFNNAITGQLTIFNQAGQMVTNIEVSNQRSLQLSVSSFATGIYVYKVNNSRGAVLYQGKFLKK